MEVGNFDSENSILHDLILEQDSCAVLESINSKIQLVNSKNKDGDTPLHVAVKLENEYFVKLLLSSGCNVNTINNRGQAPLHIAILLRNLVILKSLLQYRANPNLYFYNGETPLQCAVQLNSNEIVSLLISYEVNVFLQDCNGNTAVHRAIVKKSKCVLKLLINANADLGMLNKEGRSALNLAVSDENIELTLILIQKNADQAEYYTLPTLLSTASIKTNIVKFLHYAGTNFSAKISISCFFVLIARMHSDRNKKMLTENLKHLLQFIDINLKNSQGVNAIVYLMNVKNTKINLTLMYQSLFNILLS